MHKTPLGDRLHIALLGRRNVGKSSLINALTGQELAIVSPVAGTTTDPIYKAMEILPLGPVVLIDTAGLDDDGLLGEKRASKSLSVLKSADLALLVIDPQQGIGDMENNLMATAKELKLPLIGVLNKADLLTDADTDVLKLIRQHNTASFDLPWVKVSAKTDRGIDDLKQTIIKYAPTTWAAATIAGDLVSPDDVVILVTPIDNAAPKGRLILPQVQTIRDLLDHHCITMVVQVNQLEPALAQLKQPPALVITDSQVFRQVEQILPPSIPMTSFSILFARYKGDLTALVQGAMAMDKLNPGNQVLIAEACTHHRQEDDIGTVKIPRILNQKARGDLKFTFARGHQLPPDLDKYRLVVHCGACMINKRQMQNRILTAQRAGVPIVNYGVLMAHNLGILKRALAPFKEASAKLSDP